MLAVRNASDAKRGMKGINNFTVQEPGLIYKNLYNLVFYINSSETLEIGHRNYFPWNRII